MTVTAFRDGRVTLRSNRRTDGFTESVKDIGYQGVRNGEVVIHSMDAFAGAIGVSDSNGKMSPVVHIYTTPDDNPEFVVQALRTASRAGYIRALAKGIRERSTSFDRPVFKSMLFPRPPRAEQDEIVAYLDRETQQIDELIAEQRGLIETLRERRDAKWASLYEVAMSAGRMVQIRRVIESIVDGPFGSSLTSAHYSDEGARVIRLGNIGVNRFRDEDQAFIPLDYATRLSHHEAQPGDVVIAGLGDDKWPLGRATVLPDIGPAIVKADCYRARPNSLVNAGYLAWALSAPASRRQISLLARGATRARLNTSVVRQITIPVPSVEEQVRIVQTGKEDAYSIDALIAESEDLIALSQERRAALITAAVTGQIDVRTAA